MLNKTYKLMILTALAAGISAPACGMKLKLDGRDPIPSHVSVILYNLERECYEEKVGHLDIMKEKYRTEGPGCYYDIDEENNTVKRHWLKTGQKTPLKTVAQRNIQLDQIWKKQDEERRLQNLSSAWNTKKTLANKLKEKHRNEW